MADGGDSTHTIRYRPTPTAARFHASQANVRGIRGPIGSGKSVACVMDIVAQAMQMPAQRDGVRRSRWIAIRNTYPELVSTTLETWVKWFPMAKVVMGAPIKSRLILPLPDGTTMELQLWFLSMDKPKDVRKLKSMDCTGVWLNEASELSKAALDMASGRVARYPSKIDCPAYRSCIIMDTNPPDVDHWWYQLAEIERPTGFEFFAQPPAIRKRGGTGEWEPHPDAENVDNHVKGHGYWLEQTYGKRDDWILVMLCGQYGATMDGKPVYPNYRDDVHCAKENLEPLRGLPLILGLDFGRTPACAICQLTPRGQLRIIDEIITPEGRHGTGVADFIKNYAVPHLKIHYPGMDVRAYGDPSGIAKEGDDKSSFDRCAEGGIKALPASTNDPERRIEAVDQFLMHMVDGRPGLLISPKAHTIRRGFQGRYMYERKNIGGYIPEYKDQPKKDAYSHPHDAVQYAALMAGGSSIVNTAAPRAKPVVVTSSRGWT